MSLLLATMLFLAALYSAVTYLPVGDPIEGEVAPW